MLTTDNSGWIELYYLPMLSFSERLIGLAIMTERSKKKQNLNKIMAEKEQIRPDNCYFLILKIAMP